MHLLRVFDNFEAVEWKRPFSMYTLHTVCTNLLTFMVAFFPSSPFLTASFTPLRDIY